jgi:hypothetical protein
VIDKNVTINSGLGTDEPMARLPVLEHILGCARIAAVQTSKTLIATHRIAWPSSSSALPDVQNVLEDSLGKIEKKPKRRFL